MGRPLDDNGAGRGLRNPTDAVPNYPTTTADQPVGAKPTADKNTARDGGVAVATSADYGPAAPLTQQSRCGFCSAPLAGTSYTRFAGRDFVHYVSKQHKAAITMIGFWAACDGCAPLVR